MILGLSEKLPRYIGQHSEPNNGKTKAISSGATSTLVTPVATLNNANSPPQPRKSSFLNRVSYCMARI